jgi:hypothetical protein
VVLIALATAALIASGYPSASGAYDSVRPDALAAAFACGAVILACFPTTSDASSGPRHALGAALLMTLALFTKQTHVVLGLAIGVLFFVRSRVLGLLYVATLGTLSIGGFLALERATSGAFSAWLLGVRHHSVDVVKLAEGAQRLVFGAPHLIVIALVATTRWRVLSPRSRAWVVATAATVPAALVPYAKTWGAANNFVPGMLLAAPTAAFVLLDVLTSSYRRLGVPLLAAMLGGLLAGKVYEGDSFRPTQQMQAYARALVVKVAALDGEVLCPIHTYLPIAAGYFEEQAPLLSYLDAEAARVPRVSADAFGAYVRGRKPRWIIVASGLEEEVLRAVLADDYTVASSIDEPKTNDVFLSFPHRIRRPKLEPPLRRPEATGEVRDDDEELHRLHGFRNVAVEAREQRAGPVLAACVRRQRDSWRSSSLVRTEPSHGSNEGVPVLVGHSDVADDHVEGAFTKRRERVVHGCRGVNVRVASGNHRLQELARVALVVEHEDVQPCDARGTLECLAFRHGPRSHRGCTRHRAQRRDRDSNDELCALIVSLAFRLDRAAVELHQVLDDGETETETTVHPGDGGVGLTESLEHVRQKLPRDPLAVVFDRDVNVRVLALQPHVHATALRREFHRVRQEVPADLLEAIGVAHDGPRVWVEQRM